MAQQPDLMDLELAALFAEEPAVDDHLDVETLAAHLDGELEENKAARVEEHLARCRSCTESLLDLDALKPEAPSKNVTSGQDIVDYELAAAWRRFRLRRNKSPTSVWVSRRFLSTIAAVFLVAICGLVLQVANLRREAVRRDLPQPDVPVVYLESTRAEGKAALLELAPETEYFVVFLTPVGGSLANHQDFANWEVVIEEAMGETVWRGGNLTMNEFGALRLGLSRRFLQPGQYIVRLYGLPARSIDQRTEVASYRLDLRR